MSNKLEEARKIISETDKEMAALFVRRMLAVETVFEYKKENGLPILDKEREQEITLKNSKLIENDVIKSYYIDFLKDLMGVSKNYQYHLQNGIKVAFSGVEGAFAHIAAKRLFPQAEHLSFGDFKEAYLSVENGESDLAVIPVENSFAGEVGQAIDLIFSGNLYINGIYELPVHQNLLGLEGAKAEDIKTVISHPQALSQCGEYIKTHSLKTIEANNTALAAKQVYEAKDVSLGAIASKDTAELYGLKVLESNINKSAENTTRFAVLSKVKTEDKELSNTVLMFTVKHEAGSLAKAIGIIGKHGYSMTALRSRPMKKHSWQYYFYVEIEGNVDTKKGAKMLKDLGRVCEQLKVAGRFAPHTEI